MTMLSCSNKKELTYSQMSDHIIDQFIKDMHQKYHVNCYGKGGAFLGSVNKIIIDFKAIGPKSEGELRELVVAITEELASRFNSNVEIRPFLKNFPFTEKNIEISILLTDEKGISFHNQGSDRDRLRIVYQSKGILTYQIENDEKPYPQDVFKETYEDALKIIEKKLNPR